MTAVTTTFGTVAQLTIARFVAIAEATNDVAARDRHVASAMALTLLLAAGLIGVVLVVSTHMAFFFTQLPVGLRSAGGWCLLIVGVGVAAALPGSVIAGRFIGEQRAAVPNAIAFVGRLMQGMLVAGIAMATSDLVTMALAYATGSILMVVAQIAALDRLAEGGLPTLGAVSRKTFTQLLGFSATLLLWQVTAQIINGSDLLVLSTIDFAAVPFFAVAGTLLVIFAGVFGAVYNALLPVAARLYALGDAEELAKFLSNGVRLGLSATLVAGIPLVVSCKPLLTLWLGHAYADRAAPIVTVLVAAYLIRLSVMMYVITAVATGRHTKFIVGPILEAAANLGLSIVLGRWLGAIGVADGTLLAAGIGVAAWLVLDPLRAATGGRPGWRLVGGAAIRPGVILIPLGIVGLFMPTWVQATWAGLLAVVSVVGVVAWSAVLLPADRANILILVRAAATRCRWSWTEATG